VCESEPDRRAAQQQRVRKQSSVQAPNHGPKVLFSNARVNGIFPAVFESGASEISAELPGNTARLVGIPSFLVA
jgi:hypothetical protein